ncbi:hypothetical protein GCM10009678_03140 [Actinomadura kijaniata]|uniref:Putative RDD family membrane protein YckC n=1 Tax=Actinomadura namibiensis TaxID=182080 RepID=A0A7W3LTS1_ACTNM|nr:RDD family protein [Actinomadura namibiensis]MBA8954114.1 putative RDD family membrane protein YckC [Actinomadura namibiensis]
MSDSPHRGGQYPPPGGPAPGGGYGPPPNYQGSQWQPPRQQQPATRQWQQQPQQWHDQTGQGSSDQYGDYSSGDAADLPLASVGRRAAARLLDNLLVTVFGFALILPITVSAIGLGDSGKKAASEGGIWNWPIIFTLFAVLAVLPFVYEAVQLSMWGRTLGKRLMHVGVVRRDPAGEALTTAQAVTRAAINNIGYQVGLFFFLVLAVKVWEYAAYGCLVAGVGALMAYLWAIWDQPLRQALHDRFAGTVVIDERVEADEYHEGDSDQTQVF